MNYYTIHIRQDEPAWPKKRAGYIESRHATLEDAIQASIKEQKEINRSASIGSIDEHTVVLVLRREEVLTQWKRVRFSDEEFTWMKEQQVQVA